MSDVYQLDNLDGLDYLPKTLKSLYLGQTKKRSFSLRGLGQFPHLEDLFIEAHTRDFNVIGSIKSLQRLTIRSVTVPSLAVLMQLPHLWSLDIKLGGTRNLEDLRQLFRLKYLELWMIRGLETIDFISDMVGLQYLFLESLSRISRLPSLASLAQLRRLHIQNLCNLRDLSPVLQAKALEELIVWESPHMRPEDFEILRGHPTLRSASIVIGGPQKNERAQSILGLSEFGGIKDDFNFH